MVIFKAISIGATLFMLFTGFAQANASRLDMGNGTKFYLDKGGKQVNALEADKLATMDEQLFQCQPVEKVCNEKTGKCTIKTVK